MLRITLLLLLVFSFETFAAEVSRRLRVGDLIFISLPCYTCRLIELEEASPFSHMGVVISTKNGKTLIAQAYVKGVETILIEDFLRQKKKETEVATYRFKEFENRSERELEKQLKKRFSLFKGLPYDRDFSWDWNKMYCSELAVKLLNPFLKKKFRRKRMRFNRYYSEWEGYFRGKVPVGEWGVSPADFTKSSALKKTSSTNNPNCSMMVNSLKNL